MEEQPEKESKPKTTTRKNKPQEKTFLEFSNQIAVIGIAICAIFFLFDPIPALTPLILTVFPPLFCYWALINGLPLAWKYRVQIARAIGRVFRLLIKGTAAIPLPAPGSLSFNKDTREPKQKLTKGWEAELPHPFDGLPVNKDQYASPPMNTSEASDLISDALRLSGFNLEEDVKILDITTGPTLQQISFQLPPKVQITQIMSQSENLKNHLGVETGFDIVKPPFKSSVAFTLPHEKRSFVYLRDLADHFIRYANTAALPIILGKDIAGRPKFFDLTKQPHILIAGETGSGKSVCINSCIVSLMTVRTPEQVKFLMIDPKMVELSVYNGSPYLIEPVITDMDYALEALYRVVEDMDAKYELLMNAGVRNIEMYNQKMTAAGLELMNYTVVIVEEFSDLKDTVGNEVDVFIKRLVQKARAAGIHLILGTQSPRADVVTGIVKANIPGRICFAVSGNLEYQITMNSKGENYPMLMKKGDGMAKLDGNPKYRFQSAAIGSDLESTEYIEKLKSYARKQTRNNQFTPEIPSPTVQQFEEVDQHEDDSSIHEKVIELTPTISEHTIASLSAGSLRSNAVIAESAPISLMKENEPSLEVDAAEEEAVTRVHREPIDDEDDLDQGRVVYSATRTIVDHREPLVTHAPSTASLIAKATEIAEDMGGLTPTRLEKQLKLKPFEVMDLLKSLHEQGIIGPMDGELGLMPYLGGIRVKVTDEELYHKIKRHIAQTEVVNVGELRDLTKVKRQRVSDTIKRLVDEEFLEAIGPKPSYQIVWSKQELIEFLEEQEATTDDFPF